MVVKTFEDGSIVEFSEGSFDNWCIYLTTPIREKHAPLDKDYFTVLRGFGRVYGNEVVMNDFISIYDSTTFDIDNSVLDRITEMSKKYSGVKSSGETHANVADKIFTILYMGMIAEENKAGTVLGKRIKRLGVHQVLLENISPRIAANFSRGMRAKEIIGECIKRKF